MKLITSSIILLTLISGIYANQITLYPNHPSLLRLTHQEKPIYKGYLKLTRLPKGIIPESIQILNDDIKQWSYNYNLSSKETLLSDFINKDVLVEKENKTTTVTLIDTSESLAYVSNNETLFTTSIDTIQFPINGSLYFTPTIEIQKSSNRSGKTTITTEFFTTKIQSNIKHNANYNEEENRLELNTEIHIQNQSGESINDTQVNVEIGNPLLHYKDTPPYPSPTPKRGKLMSTDSTETQNTESSLKIKLNDPQTINTGLNAITLYSTQYLETENIIRFTPGYRTKNTFQACELFLSIQNTNQQTIPEGMGSLSSKNEYVGTSHIPKISPSETVEIYYGKSLDVMGRKTHTLKDKTNEFTKSDYTIEIKNLKDTPVHVEITDTLDGSTTEITSTSRDYSIISQNKIKFYVQIPKNDTIELSYTIKKRGRY